MSRKVTGVCGPDNKEIYFPGLRPISIDFFPAFFPNPCLQTFDEHFSTLVIILDDYLHVSESFSQVCDDY